MTTGRQTIAAVDGIDGDGWHSTGAYCTAKLTFSHGSTVKVWGASYNKVIIKNKMSRFFMVQCV